jgi:hypothetical protein
LNVVADTLVVVVVHEDVLADAVLALPFRDPELPDLGPGDLGEAVLVERQPRR